MTDLYSFAVKSHFGAELELTQVSRFDSGTYLCLANNGIPPTVSNEDAKAKFGDFEAVLPYLRKTQLPG